LHSISPSRRLLVSSGPLGKIRNHPRARTEPAFPGRSGYAGNGPAYFPQIAQFAFDGRVTFFYRNYEFSRNSSEKSSRGRAQAVSAAGPTHSNGGEVRHHV